MPVTLTVEKLRLESECYLKLCWTLLVKLKKRMYLILIGCTRTGLYYVDNV